jgi:hypothetical protein
MDRVFLGPAKGGNSARRINALALIYPNHRKKANAGQLPAVISPFTPPSLA